MTCIESSSEVVAALSAPATIQSTSSLTGATSPLRFLPPGIEPSPSKVCPMCGGTKTPGKAACWACYTEARKNSFVDLVCTFCGAQFQRMRCEVKKQHKRGHADVYCGLDCSRAHHAVKNSTAATCVICSKETPKKRRNAPKFCSPACRELGKPAPKLLPRPCAVCTDTFQPKSSRTTYCSKACADVAHSRRMVGAGNSHYKDGRSYALWFDKMRPLILERDGGRCHACEAKEVMIPRVWRGRMVPRSNLVIHHCDEDPRNNRPENLVTMCQTCHAVHHKSKQTPFPGLSAYAEQASASMTSKWKESTISLQKVFSFITAS